MTAVQSAISHLAGARFTSQWLQSNQQCLTWQVLVSLVNDSSPIINVSPGRCSFHQPMTAVQSVISHLAGACLISWRHAGNELKVVGWKQHLESFVDLLKSSLFIVGRPEPITISTQHRQLEMVLTWLLQHTEHTISIASPDTCLSHTVLIRFPDSSR